MFRIPFPFTDSALVLTPPFESLPGWLQVLLGVLGLALSGGLLIWLYSYEVRLVSPSRAIGLLALRVVVLALLWFICFQPVVSRPTSEQLSGRVMIALDRSDSMGVSDPQRDPADKLRLARGLGLASDIVKDADLDDWIKQYGESGRVNFPPTPAGETARSLHNQVCARVDALTRLQVGQQVLNGSSVKLIEELAKRHEIEIVGFSQEIGEMTADEVNALAPSAGDGAKSAYTDLRLPLLRALERSGPDRGKVLGIVLLTDGQHNWGPPPAGKAGELGKLNVPIFPIVLGARTPPADIAVTTVAAPTTVFKGSELPVEARIQVNGLPDGREILVTLNRDGKEPLEERLRHDGKTTNYTVRFQPRMDEVGTQKMTVVVRHEKEELRSDNNSRSLVVNVADDKAKVLLIDGEARWEYHYLASALTRDRSMQLKTVVFSQPRLGDVSEEDLQKSGYPALQLPPELEALNGYDCIILGDVSPDQLPMADRIRLEKYVSERGGTLVFLAGKRYMPQAFGTTATERDNDPLWRLLPIQDTREVKPVEGFPVTLTAEGRLAAFLQLESTSEVSDRRWAALPLHYWGLIGKAKPGAVPLGWYREGNVSPDPKVQAQRERDNALIVRQNYGFGRVMYIGLDSTWRWRFKTGDTYHHKFWGQVIRWAASDKPLITGNEFVRFGTRDPIYRAGQEIEFIVRLSDLARSLPPDALAGARLYRVVKGKPDENAGLVPLKRREHRPRELEAQLRDLAPGDYAVELAIPDLADQLQPPVGPDGKPIKMRANFTVSPPDSAEMVELGTNRPLLEDIAQRSGGEVFEPEDAGKLVERLKKAIATRQHRSETRLGRSAWTLILFLLLLSVEWVARKFAGLP